MLRSTSRVILATPSSAWRRKVRWPARSLDARSRSASVRRPASSFSSSALRVSAARAVRLALASTSTLSRSISARRAASSWLSFSRARAFSAATCWRSASNGARRALSFSASTAFSRDNRPRSLSSSGNAPAAGAGAPGGSGGVGAGEAAAVAEGPGAATVGAAAGVGACARSPGAAARVRQRVRTVGRMTVENSKSEARNPKQSELNIRKPKKTKSLGWGRRIPTLCRFLTFKGLIPVVSDCELRISDFQPPAPLPAPRLTLSVPS